MKAASVRTPGSMWRKAERVNRPRKDFYRMRSRGGEVAFWTNYIQTNSRGSVVLGFVTSDEYRLDLLQGIPNDPNMPGFYEQYLHRPIDPSGAQFWLQQLKLGYPQDAILEGILGSDEYYKRA